MIEINAIIGIFLGLGIGWGCRYFELPLPAPHQFLGAVLVMAMTLGYIAGGYFL